MFQTQRCGGGDGGDAKSPGVETLGDGKEKAGTYGHNVEYQCTSQETDANALAKAIDSKMQLCPRMGNRRIPTGLQTPRYNQDQQKNGLDLELVHALATRACLTGRLSLVWRGQSY